MVYKVGSKEFTLTKKNIRMRNLYADMANLSADLSLLAEDADEMKETIVEEGEPETLPEKLKKRKQIREKYLELDERRRELTDKLAAKREELLRLILEKNGYEYDADFWLDEADVEDLNNIVTGIFKEASSGKPLRA